MPTQLDEKSVSNFEKLERPSMRNVAYSVAMDRLFQDVHRGEHPEGISPLEAVNLYRDSLSLHERKEILRYDKIFYVGCTAEKHSVSNCFQFPVQKPSNHMISQHFNDKMNNGSNHNINSNINTNTTNNNSNHNNNADDNQSMFNDSENFYRIIQHDHIAYRYEILSLLGKGSFGQVVSAYDHMKGCKVALKIIRTEPRFTRQAREEIRILETLRDMRESYGNGTKNRYDFPVIHLYEYFTFRKHICMTFELLNINLYDLLKLNKFTGLPRDRVRRICFQVLKALQFIQKAGIIHCDLKPENVLLVWPQSPESENNSTTTHNNPHNHNHHSGYQQKYQNHSNNNSNNNNDSVSNLRSTYYSGAEQKDYVKLIDFGSSCFRKGQPYPYIQSRFYRAPEILLRLGYDEAIDTWSFGCLIAELINGLPLFPGEDEADQMACIMEVLGLPHPTLLRHSSQIDRYFIEYKCDKLKPSTLEAYDKIGVRVNKDSVYLPRYCSIRYSMVDNSPQLLPGLSKRGGHVRGIPNSMPLLQAITQSRLRRYKRKDTRSVSNLTTTVNHAGGGHKMSEEEEAYMDEDNELVVNLVASCLSWLPNERIQSNKAVVHSWFNHFYHNHNKNNSSNNNNNNGNNGKSHTGFRSPLRVRSMEVSKFVSSKFMNELSERQLIQDYRSSRESLGKDTMMLSKPELGGGGAGGGGLRNHGQQKGSRLNMNTSHLFNLDVTGNNASLNDLTSVRNSFMIDAQVSPITVEEVKLAQRNSQITIVPRVPVQNQQINQSDYYSNTLGLSDSQIITSIKDLSQPVLSQPQPQTTATTMSATKLNLTSSSSSSSSLSVSSAAVPATASASGRVALVYSSSSNNNNSNNSNNNKNGNIESGNNRDGRLLAATTLANTTNAVTTSNQNTNNNNACDDITIANTYNSLFKLTDNTTVGGYRSSGRSSSSSSSSSSSGSCGAGINYTSVNDIKHQHQHQHQQQQSSSPLSFHPPYNAPGILTSLNDKSSKGNLLLKSYPTGYTKPDTIYQSKMILDRNITSNTNHNDSNGIGIVKPISGYIVNTYTTHDPNNSSNNMGNNHKTKIITDTESSSDSPTLLITTGGGVGVGGGGGYCSASESTPHLPSLMKLNANCTNSPISKIINPSNRYSYSNLHQPSVQPTLATSSQVQAPFISSLRIDKPLNNSMHNIVNRSKMKLSYDNQGDDDDGDDQSELSINNDGVKKRYSVPSRSRLIDIPQSEYEIPITGNTNTTTNNNNSSSAGSMNDRYAKQDLHFIPVTSNAFSSITLTSSTFSPSSNTVTLSSPRNTTNPNGPNLLHNFNTSNTPLHNNNNNNGNNNNASYKYPSPLSYQRESHQSQLGGSNGSQYPQEQPRRYIATNRFSSGNSTSITPNNTIANMNNYNSNNNSSNYRKLSDFPKPSMEYINAYDQVKNNDIIVYKNPTNGYPAQSVGSTATLPEIAPKPLNRTKMLLLSNNNNNNGTTSTTYNDNGSSKIIYDTHNYEPSNPMKWRLHKSSDSGSNNSTNLYAPQPYSQPNMNESASQNAHRMITQRLPQHSNNNHNNNSNNGSMNCINNTNGYVDQVQPYYTS
ncbi:unnamed protein product [Trichobilharzia szidati]|nr:unnamed protein product [Trichobilharzia szidati]